MKNGQIQVKKGLTLPIKGEPEQVIEPGNLVQTVAVVGTDFLGLKPAMSVNEGDTVEFGQKLFEDRKTPGVIYTAPASGKIVAVNRGPKRILESVEIEISENDETDPRGVTPKPQHGGRDAIVESLVASGLWTSLRTRPFSKVANPKQIPHALFITAIDTNPLAADPVVVLRGNEDCFAHGIEILTQLTEGKTYLCKSPGSPISGQGCEIVEFAGPHPAGLVGTHIHYLNPVGPNKAVWHVNYQDVIAIGAYFLNGELRKDRVVALGGPQVGRPRLLRTRLGAKLSELVAGELKDGENRLVSGSILSGRLAAGPFDFLGRYHSQVSCLLEGRVREFLGWQKPGVDKFSVKNIFASKLFPRKLFGFTTSVEGSDRAMVPIGAYEKVMPLDIEPVFLLRALITGDTEQEQLLGGMELDEEDLGLCTFVCPGKYEYGPLLRKNLEQIEKEG
jgi:Na+-transporting NADH:ubiquinone oxidoreductase subunit A